MHRHQLALDMRRQLGDLDAAFKRPATQGISVVLRGRGLIKIDGLPGPRVLADTQTGARLAVEHLLGLGHRRILHLTGPTQNTLSISRAAGVAEALATIGLPPASRMEGAFTLRSGHAASVELLSLSERPTAVFCDNDEMAIGLMAGLRAAGIRTPEGISVIGFVNIEVSAYASVPLTTVRQKRAHLGRRAAEMLLAQRDGPSPESEVILPVELVVRSSTAPVRDASL